MDEKLRRFLESEKETFVKKKTIFNFSKKNYGIIELKIFGIEKIMNIFFLQNG